MGQDDRPEYDPADVEMLRDRVKNWILDHSSEEQGIEELIPFIDKCESDILMDIMFEEPIVAYGILAANFTEV